MVDIYIPAKYQIAYAQVKKREEAFALMLVSRIIYIKAFRPLDSYAVINISINTYF